MDKKYGTTDRGYESDVACTVRDTLYETVRPALGRIFDWEDIVRAIRTKRAPEETAQLQAIGLRSGRRTLEAILPVEVTQAIMTSVPRRSNRRAA